MRHFKKISIVFSLMFLVLVSPAFFGQGDAKADICQGTPTACTARSGHDDCVGIVSSSILSGTGNGCTFAPATSACTGTAVACASISSSAACVSGCEWVVTGSANDNAFVSTLCRALQIVTGKGGKAFAAFAIISIGIGFFTGKVSWGLMIGVTAGIAAMFGAPTIVAAIAGGDAIDCSGS